MEKSRIIENGMLLFFSFLFTRLTNDCLTKLTRMFELVGKFTCSNLSFACVCVGGGGGILNLKLVGVCYLKTLKIDLKYQNGNFILVHENPARYHPRLPHMPF